LFNVVDGYRRKCQISSLCWSEIVRKMFANEEEGFQFYNNYNLIIREMFANEEEEGFQFYNNMVVLGSCQ
jgi:hypothetical protein